MKIFLLNINCRLENTVLKLWLRYSHHRPWLLWSGLWIGFNSPFSSTIIWQPQRHTDSSPARKGISYWRSRGTPAWSVYVYRRMNMCPLLLQACAHRWKNVYYDSEHILPHGYCSIIPPTLQGRTKPLIPCYEGTVEAPWWAQIRIFLHFNPDLLRGNTLKSSKDTDYGLSVDVFLFKLFSFLKKILKIWRFIWKRRILRKVRKKYMIIWCKECFFCSASCVWQRCQSVCPPLWSQVQPLDGFN